MPGLDVLYCADAPARAMKSIVDRFNPRRAAMARLESACFEPQSKTRLLLLAEPQRADYERIWRINAERVIVLPPTIERTRAQPLLRSGNMRHEMRARLGVSPSTVAWLFVAGFPQTKGLDRIIDALPLFPNVKLLCAGFDLGHGKHSPFCRSSRNARRDRPDRVAGPSRRCRRLDGSRRYSGASVTARHHRYRDP